jgi:hypothetical protein
MRLRCLPIGKTLDAVCGGFGPEEDFRANSAELEAPELNYKNGSPHFRLTPILRRKFASYRVVGSQLPTVACLIHAEARCVQMCYCSFATFLVLC